MTKKSIERHLEEYYSAQTLRDDLASSLTGQVSARRDQTTSRSVLFRLLPFAAAAAIALALTVVSWSGNESPPANTQLAVATDDATRTADRGGDLPSGPRTPTAQLAGHQPIEVVGPREAELVAVKFHYDGCPFSQDTQPVYEELKERFATQVAFQLFNITDEEQILESRKHADELGVEWLCERGMNSGLICLVKPKTHEVVATLQSSGEKQFLLAAFKQQLQ